MPRQSATSSQSSFHKNALKQSSSPYLLQHADNPVHWQEWGEDVLRHAQDENKPLLVSIGYAACHWCHVMAHESFENDDIAAVMNDHFVNIKIDREERPDLDHIYQSALAMMGQQGGWPLTMFCTPDGKPFWGGTYFPPEARMGRPGFTDVLQSVYDTYKAKPDAVNSNVRALEGAMEELSSAKPGDPNVLSQTLIDDICDQLLTYMDREKGGMRGAPKFPNVSLLNMLWRAYTRRGEQAFKSIVLLTLKEMGDGGIYDHIGGGFARYSVDENWHVPHFEKMLYDNALLLDLMTEAWRDTHDPTLERKIRETIDWAHRELMVGAKGSKKMAAFGSSLDADSIGPGGKSEEGAYYTWTEAEIDEVLDDNTARLFKQAYNIRPDGNWAEGTQIRHRHGRDEGINILYRVQQDDSGELADLEEVLINAGTALLTAREKRRKPFYDDKVLTDWNGMMIRALAHASRIFDEPDWLKSAENAFAFIADQCAKDKKGRLYHSWRQGKARHNALADDYAFMISAALALYEVTGKNIYRDKAIAWAQIMKDDFWDEKEGGFFQTSEDSNDVLLRPKIVADTAVPSANGQMAENLPRLAAIDTDNNWSGLHNELITAFSGAIEGSIYGLFTFFNGVMDGETLAHVTVKGDEDDDAVRALRQALARTSRPDCLWVDDVQKNRKAEAVICKKGQCYPSVENPDDLEKQLVSSN